jgi:SSS family solute:Na+ symporter
MTALLATVMSTIDSYSFLAASTFGRDIVWRFFRPQDDQVTLYTRWGLLVSTALAMIIALFFESVIVIWHHIGSIATPALLIPLFTAHVGTRRMPPRQTAISMICSGILSLVWLISGYISASGDYWLGIQPIFPGIILSVVFYLTCSKLIR